MILPRILLCFFFFNLAASQVCVDKTTAANEGLNVPWVPALNPKLSFQVKNAGAARITVTGDTYPKITAVLGIDLSNSYKEVCTCTDDTASLSCSSVGGTISVQTALYGRRVLGTVLCPYMSDPNHAATTNTGCDSTATDDLSTVQGLCDGMPTCSVPITCCSGGDTFNPDPCVRTFKYLRITYTCTGVTSPIDPVTNSAGTGTDAKIFLQESNGGQKQATSLGVLGLSTSAYTELYLMVNDNGFQIGFEDEEPFISITSDLNELTSISSVLFEGLGVCSCEDDPPCTSDVIASNWKICDNGLQSIAIGKPTDQSNCHDSPTKCGDVAVDGNLNTEYGTSPYCFYSGSAANAWWRVDLEKEYHVFAVEVIKRTSFAPERIENQIIRVGSCKESSDYTSNTQCGIPVTAAEAAADAELEPIFRICPTNTYGQYVYISDADGRLQFCEVNVYGQFPENPTQLNFDPTSYVALESEGSITIDVTRTEGGNNPTCTYFDIDDGVDCSAITTTADTTVSTGDIWLDPSDNPYTDIKIGPGGTTKEVTLILNNNEDVEDDEYLGLCLDSVIGATGGSSSSIQITVTDDDPHHYLPTDTVYSISESAGTPIFVTVKRSGYLNRKTQAEISTVAVSALESTDYVGLSREVVTFIPGDDEEMVAINIVDNKEFEPAETFMVELNSASGGDEDTTPVTITITDDDPKIGFSSATYSQSESGPLTSVQIVKTEHDRLVTFKLTTDSTSTTAISGIDYESVNRELIFPAGQTSLTIDDIPIYDDELVEGPETFELVLTTSDASLAPGGDRTTVTIIDDDSKYSVEDKAISILESKGIVNVGFKREGNDLEEEKIEVSVSGSLEDNSFLATNEIDFLTSGTNQVTFQQGSPTAELNIPIVKDKYVEYNEIFYVVIENVSGEIEGGRQKTTITILNDDAFFSLAKVEYAVLESASLFQVLINRGPSGNIAGYLEDEVSIYLSTSTGEATEDIDYQPVSNKEITFLPGESVKTCPITIYDDKIPENEEKIYLTITNANLDIDLSKHNATVKINDDDGLISLFLEDSEKIVREDKGLITFTVNRKGFLNSNGEDQSLKRTAFAIITAIRDSAAPGTDFQRFSRTLNFGIGQASVTDTIDIMDDDYSEPSETFRIVITDADGEIDVGNYEVTVTITDNDVERFTFEETAYTAGESCGQLRVSVIRTGSSGQGTTLLLSASDGEATYPLDYSTGDVTMSFTGNQEKQSVTFDIVRDAEEEGPETFTLSLSKLSGSGEISPTGNVATVTIQDQQGVFSFESGHIDTLESIGTLRLSMSRSGDPCASANIYVSTQDVGAKEMLDYTSYSGRQVTFQQGSSSAFVDVDIIDDNLIEADEDFLLKISSVDYPVENGEIKVTIQDNDSEFRFRDDEYLAPESQGTVTLTIEREGNTIETAIAYVQTVPNRGDAIATRDYTPFSSRLVEFAASENTKTLTVAIDNDDTPESDETFYVTITSVTNGIVSTPGEAMVIITDDDGSTSNSNVRGFSSTAIIALAAGGGGAVALLTITGIIACVIFMSRPSAPNVPRASPSYNKARYQYGPRGPYIIQA